jgi:hypothetical protein
MDKRKSKAETLYLQRQPNIESLIKKATLGIISEKSILNYREGKKLAERREERLELQRLKTKEKFILDCIADKLMKKNDFYHLRNIKHWKNLLAEDTAEDNISFLPKFEEMLSLLKTEDMVFLSKSGKPEDGEEYVGIAVALSTKEIKEKLGLSRNIPCWKISEWVWGLFDKAYFVGTDRVIYKDGRFEKWRFPVEDKYLHVCSKTVGKLSRRKNIEEEHIELEEFIFVFKSEWSKLFLLEGLFKGQFTIFPKPFYKLKDGHSELVRYLSIWSGVPWWKQRLHPITDLKNLLGLKSKNINNLKKNISRILDELKAKGFIQRWESYGRGWDTKYRIKVSFKRELFAAKGESFGSDK